MTTRYLIAPAAEQDVIEIGDYIARDNRTAAAKLVAEIYKWFPRLAERPALGHRRPDLTTLPVRFWSVRGRYLIIYRPERRPIEIARVLNAARDIPTILARSLD